MASKVSHGLGRGLDALLGDAPDEPVTSLPVQKIEPNPDAPEYILTIWGIGYKFNDKL